MKLSSAVIHETGLHVIGMCHNVLTDVLYLFQVTCIGQLIGLVVAKTRPLAQRAAKLVNITYKDLPAIITLEVNNTFYFTTTTYNTGGYCKRVIL